MTPKKYNNSIRAYSCALVFTLFVISSSWIFPHSEVQSGECEQEQTCQSEVFPERIIQYTSPDLRPSVDVKIDGRWYPVMDNPRYLPEDELGEMYLPSCEDFRSAARFHPDASAMLRLLRDGEMCNLADVGVDDFPMDEIESLDMLDFFESIEFNSNDDIGFSDATQLARMSNLKNLELSWCLELDDLRPLGELRRLESLAVPCHSTNDSIQVLREVGLLERLRFFKKLNPYKEDKIEDYGFLAEMKNLEGLELGGSENEIASLALVPSLKRLRLWRYYEDISFLSGLSELEELTIECSPSEANFEMLSKLSQLRRLDVVFTNAGFKPVGPLPKTDADYRSFIKMFEGRDDFQVMINDVNLQNADLSQLDLRNIQFRNCDFENASFEDAILENYTLVRPTYYSQSERKLKQRSERAFAHRNLTAAQLRSTWNYKNGQMEDVNIGMELAAGADGFLYLQSH
jgi:hypothetical protein